MKYDEIILDCQGDCDKCDVYLECQYQTSSGEEKQKILKELIARDNTTKESSVTETEPTAVEPIEAQSKATVEPVEAQSEVTVEADATENEVNENEVPEAEVAQTTIIETENDKSEAEVTPLNSESVEEIYSRVFGLDKLTQSKSEKEPEATETTVAETVKETFADDKKTLEAEKVNEKTDEAEVAEADSAKKEESVEVEAEADFAKPCDNEEICKDESKKQELPEVTPLTKDRVEEIYSQVFGLNKLTTTNEDAEKVAEKTANLEQKNVAEEVTDSEPEEKAQKEASEEVQKETQSENGEEVATSEDAESQEDGQEEAPKKDVFKLVPSENNDELMQNMCAKRGRKLIYRPNEAIITKTFTVLGTDKKNEVGEKIKDVIDAEIKQGVKAGYLDKFDGLNSSEIKEEYEDDIVYEFADQEFKKTGVIYDGKKIRVYIYDWDGKACHHVGYIDEKEAAEFIPYFIDKDNYSFDVCGIITGGKGKRVVRQGDSLKIIKEKGNPIGIDADIAIIKRKD